MSTARRGFTVVEMIIVVAIIGVTGALAVTSFSRHQENFKVEQALKVLRGKIEHSRMLAMESSAHIGDPNATLSCGGPLCWTFVNCDAPAKCAGFPGNEGYMWGVVDPAGPNFYSIPYSVAIDPLNGGVTVTCQNGTLPALVLESGGGNTGYVPNVPINPNPMCFAFTGTGRRFPAGALAVDTWVQMVNPVDGSQYGLRILQSGILCSAQNPAASGALTCDSD